MKIGVYVGSFNPVHKGHIKIANYIIDKNLVDKLLIIPTHNYWDKNNLINLEDRINMLQFYETDRIIIDSDFSEKEYTYQVINALKEKYKNSEFSLILGADNIVNFDKWKNFKDLLKLELIIFKRNDIDIKYYLNKLEKTEKYIIVEDLDNINISSTLVRDNINDLSLLKKYLDIKVIDYIEKNNLYRE
jgi:nicotinate-nucleotide adenylyltransferase